MRLRLAALSSVDFKFFVSALQNLRTICGRFTSKRRCKGRSGQGKGRWEEGSMRLVHEYNRDKVEHYLHRKHLEKIARLEEFDRRGEL